MSSPFRAKKSLGQNFLRSTAIVKKICQSADIQKGETVVEIGPGKGILTRELLHAGAKVIAIEKDHRLIPELSETFAEALANTSLTLIHDDILDMRGEMEKITEHAPYKVVANIPYYISGALLRLFLENTKKPTMMIVMLQKEVAKRIVARDEKESILSISVKAYGVPSIVSVVKKELFKPVPKVDSAILKIDTISKNFFANIPEDLFFRIVKTAFGQKRKTIAGTLRSLWATQTSDILIKSGVSLKHRPEDLTLKEWQAITQEAQNYSI